MAEPNVWGLTASQLKRLGEMLAAFESGTLWPSEKAIQKPRSELARVPYHNDSGEEIPAYGVMRIANAARGPDGFHRLTCRKPNDTFQSVYLINSGHACPVSSDWWGTYLWHSGTVLCDDTYVPAYGQEWGPVSGEWRLVRNRPGFLIDGGPTGSGAAYRAVAKQHPVLALTGKPFGNMTKGTAGPVTLWMPKASSTPPFATADYEDAGYSDLQALPLGSDVADELFCSIRFEGSGWLAYCWEQ